MMIPHLVYGILRPRQVVSMQEAAEDFGLTVSRSVRASLAGTEPRIVLWKFETEF